MVMAKKWPGFRHFMKNICQCFTDQNGNKGKLNFDIFQIQKLILPSVRA